MGNVLMHGYRVHLESWEHDWAVYVGVQRHVIREHSSNAAHYDPARMEDNLRASRAAACVEMAVAKYKGTYWSGHYWPLDEHDLHKGIADVEPNYEVRRVREPGNPVAVRRRDKGRVIVCGWADPDTDFRDVYLMGEIDATEGFKRGMTAPYDPTNTRLVPLAFLEPYARAKKAG